MKAYRYFLMVVSILILLVVQGCEKEISEPSHEYGSVTDIEGNSYKTIEIGSQVWMAENLRTTKYADGTVIPLVEDSVTWVELAVTDKAYCWYENSTTNRDAYGGLYTWAASMNGLTNSDTDLPVIQGVCPDGWHLPNDEEWKELEKYLGMNQTEADGEGWRGSDEGVKLKESGTKYWSGSGDATNESGFSALPGGRRVSKGSFSYINIATYFWVASDNNISYAWFRKLDNHNLQVNRSSIFKTYGFSVRCIKDPMNVAPAAAFTASSTGILEDDTVHFTDKSIFLPTSWNWDFGDGNSSTIQHPSHIYSEVGNFTVSLIATNENGSDTLSKTDFISVTKRHNFGTVTDIDNNIYKTIQIGNQIWMAENLRTTRYADGTAIPLVEDSASWVTLTVNDKAYCWYDNSTLNRNTYGGLYTWAAIIGDTVNSSNPSGIQGVCPDGWHLPSDVEWKELEMYLGMSQAEADDVNWRGTDEGDKLKSTIGWSSGGNGTNESGFTALPGGRRGDEGAFSYKGGVAYFWTGTETADTHAWFHKLGYYSSEVNRVSNYKNNGFSVRCIGD